MENNTVAIVILNWNGEALLRRFLPGVLENSRARGVFVVVADNGSSDGSVAFVRSAFPEIRVIELEKNHGFAGGYNQALKQVDATFYVLLNSDVEPGADWLWPCVGMMQEDEKVAAVQPKVLSLGQRERFEYAGAAGGYIDRWGYPFCRGRVLSVTETDTGQYDNMVPLFWATGASLFIRAEAFHGAGGFDEDFFAHMEEIDLCWRLKNRGWKILAQPASKVYHLGGATLSYQSPRKVYLNFRNSLWMLVKNLPKGKLIPVLFPRLVLDGIAAIHFLLSGKPDAFYAVARAHAAFYRSLAAFLRKRRALVPETIKGNHSEIFRGSIVFRFYLKKQRKFSDYPFKIEH